MAVFQVNLGEPITVGFLLPPVSEPFRITGTGFFYEQDALPVNQTTVSKH